MMWKLKGEGEVLLDCSQFSILIWEINIGVGNLMGLLGWGNMGVWGAINIFVLIKYIGTIEYWLNPEI